MAMHTHNVEHESITSRQIAFEVAARITAGVGIMITIVRQLYVAALHVGHDRRVRSRVSNTRDR
jgi:hypothetical protein